jgi:signal transduction histidine kinase
VANELYRIAQEAVTNALRHGHARRITVRLSRADGGVRLAVLDNGCGMPADVSHAQGMGLRVMQYRASLIGGKLAVQRRRSGGTEVLCRVEKIAASR